MKRTKAVHPVAAINALAAARKIVPRGKDHRLSAAQFKRLQARYGQRVLRAAAELEGATAPEVKP